MVFPLYTGLMDLASLIKKYIPNPIAASTTPTELNKKLAVIGESFNLVSSVRNIIGLAVIGFIAVLFFSVPFAPVALLVIFEMLSQSITTYIAYRKLHALSALSTTEDGKSFKDLLVTNELYDVMGNLVAFVFSAISAVLVFVFFGQQLVALVTRYYPIQSTFLQSIIFIIADLIVCLIRYQLLTKIDGSKNYAQVEQAYTLIKKKLELVTNVPGMSVILLLMASLGVPLFIVFIFLGWIILMVIVSLVMLKRVSSVDLSAKSSTVTGLPTLILEPMEHVVGSIFGIMNMKRTGFSFLGVGKTTYPENTLLVTDKRLLFVEIPMQGGDKMIDSGVNNESTAYSDTNFFWNRGAIKEKGSQLLSSMPIDAFAKQYGVSEIPFVQIATVTLKNMQLTIVTTASQQSKYLFMDKEYTDMLTQQLPVVLKEKFVAAP